MVKRSDPKAGATPTTAATAATPTAKPGLARARPWQAARPGSATARQDPSDELLTILAFDIASDKARRTVGEICKDYGLGRTQWSVFEGAITRNRREELWARLVKILDAAEGGGRVAVYVIGGREAALATRYGTNGSTKKAGGNT
jgi:CRISPR-associated protein Cas2